MRYAGIVRQVALAAALGLLPRTQLAAQASVDTGNRFPNVGVLMVWRVDSAGRPVELRGFASGTLIRDRVMVTAGHFTAPGTATDSLPASIRIFASFSPTNAKDPSTWIRVVRLATHPSMPHCPPPPQCDPTDDSLVAPLETGIADVGLVQLERPPAGIAPARLAEPGILEKSEGTETVIAGYGTTMPQNKERFDRSLWDGRRRIRISRVRRVIDETWALWSIPSYVCSGDSGGGIFMSSAATNWLVANVSDGGHDCRTHNNNNRLDTRSIQKWIDDTIARRFR